jgi:hypothetical protein
MACSRVNFTFYVFYLLLVGTVYSKNSWHAASTYVRPNALFLCSHFLNFCSDFLVVIVRQYKVYNVHRNFTLKIPHAVYFLKRLILLLQDVIPCHSTK